MTLIINRKTLLGFQPFCSRVKVASGLGRALSQMGCCKAQGGWDSKIVCQSCDNVSHRDAASRKNKKFFRLPTPTVLTTASFSLATSARLSGVYIGRPTHCCASSSAMGLAWMTMLWQRHKPIQTLNIDEQHLPSLKLPAKAPYPKKEAIAFQVSIFRDFCC